MEELMKSDIFFFITGAAIIIITIVWLVVLYYIYKIVRNVKDVTDKVRAESDKIIEDVAFIRKGIEKGGRKITKAIKNKIAEESEKE